MFPYWRNGFLLEMPCASQQYVPRWSPEVYALAVAPVRTAWGLRLWWAICSAWLAPAPVGCQALPCAEAASCWLAGHKVADRVTSETPRASAGLVVGGVRLKAAELFPAGWWVKPGPGLVLSYTRAEQVLESGCRAQGSRSWCLDYWVWTVPGSWVEDLGCPEACVGLLVARAGAQLSQ